MKRIVGEEQVLPTELPILVIAHRLSTVLIADRVVVLGERGQVVDEGPPQMLLARKGEFWRLFQKQVCTLERGQVLTSVEDK